MKKTTLSISIALALMVGATTVDAAGKSTLAKRHSAGKSMLAKRLSNLERRIEQAEMRAEQAEARS